MAESEVRSIAHNKAEPPAEEMVSLLQAGITAARVGHGGWARELLTDAVELDPDCLPGWLWLSDVAESLEEKKRCLEQVLRLDPEHEMARRGLVWLQTQPEPQAPSQPPPRPEDKPEPSAARRPVAAVAPTSVPELAPSLVGSPLHRPPPEPEPLPQPPLSEKPEVDDLLEAGINAASSRQFDVARELLGRVIEVNEKHIAAWLWLSYVADTSQERERCVKRMLNIAGVDPTLRPTLARAPATAAPGLGTATVPVELDLWALAEAGNAPVTFDRPGARPASKSRANALRPALSPAVAAGTPAARPLYETLTADATTAVETLRRSILAWASAWTLTAQAYLVGIVVAELLTTYAQAAMGLLAHGLLLVTLLVHASRVESKAKRAFLASMAFAPLIRILSLSLPLAQIPLIYWYLITSVPLFAALLVAGRTLGFSWSNLGLNLRRWPLQVVIGLSGIVFGAVEYYILRPEPLAQGLEWGYLWRPALILLVSTGLLEEMIFRGLLQRTSIDSLGRWGLLYVPLLFAALHIGYQMFIDVVFVFLVGLFFALVVQRTRSLVGVTISHGLTNIILFLVMPFLMA